MVTSCRSTDGRTEGEDWVVIGGDSARCNPAVRGEIALLGNAADDPELRDGQSHVALAG